MKHMQIYRQHLVAKNSRRLMDGLYTFITSSTSDLGADGPVSAASWRVEPLVE
jgi:hypothetical protein